MNTVTLTQAGLRAALQGDVTPAGEYWHLGPVDLYVHGRWQRLLDGVYDYEFSTSAGGADGTALVCPAAADPAPTWRLVARQPAWEATGELSWGPLPGVLQRRQTYRVQQSGPLAVHPGFRLPADAACRYTYPLKHHAQPWADLGPARLPVDWAVPFPFHIWHGADWVAVYGLDKRVSAGTLDWVPPAAPQPPGLRVYWPDSAAYADDRPATAWLPTSGCLAAGQQVELVELLAARPLAAGEEPLLAAVRLATQLLLDRPPAMASLPGVATRLAAFYPRCGLWDADALGPGRGWFSNMWVRTQTGPAARRGEMSGYYDLGWGEGIAVETLLGMVRYWQRTGDAQLLPYVTEISRNIALFRRPGPGDQPYLDRSDGRRYGDFMLDHAPGQRVWTHSLGHLGSQLLQLWAEAPDYPEPAARAAWWTTAAEAARFLATHQRPDGDLPDVFDEADQEALHKTHRVTARAVVCGLWVRYAEASGDLSYIDRALRLAAAVAPQLRQYEYANQMIDGLVAQVEFVDGEAAYYVLEGLVPLFAATGAPSVLEGCHQAAAFGALWTYLYDLPLAHQGVARGGQCCRMDDFPLLYPIGPAKAVGPLLALADLTGEPLFLQLAEEAVAFLSHWQLEAPGQPWDGGMLHALGQYCGRHWGPDLAGQVDTGMATGNALAAIEAWLARPTRQRRGQSPGAPRAGRA